MLVLPASYPNYERHSLSQGCFSCEFYDIRMIQQIPKDEWKPQNVCFSFTASSAPLPPPPRAESSVSLTVILLRDNGQYPAAWPILRLSETASMHPFSFSKPLTTLKKYFQPSTLCPRALRPSTTDCRHRKHT